MSLNTTGFLDKIHVEARIYGYEPGWVERGPDGVMIQPRPLKKSDR